MLYKTKQKSYNEHSLTSLGTCNKKKVCTNWWKTIIITQEIKPFTNNEEKKIEKLERLVKKIKICKVFDMRRNIKKGG